uniref:DUF4340 domain-containing protein n=1 Tax=Candidatus Kentrum sp. LFY TaxID=2126342 RepID=A0A450WYX7_9GAMM|nr:MAG: protein of unknown function (DUF4340) [Candidatus Kentron sp. LFY]
MRKSNSFLILALVTVVVVMATIYVQRESGKAAVEEGFLFPDLSEKLDRTAQVRISKGVSVVELHRQGKDAWSVRDRADHPANLAKIYELLLGTAGLERLEQKTRNPERYARLGLAETANGDEQGAMRVVMQDEQGVTLADYFIGKRSTAKGRRARDEMYVRIQDDPVVWLVEGILPYGVETTDWLRGEILTLDEKRIRGVRITHPDGEEVIVGRDDREATDYRLIGLPQSAKPRPYLVNGIASDMAKLRLQDVRSIEDIDLSDGKRGTKIRLTTFDGMHITMKTWQFGQDTLARFDAGFDPKLIEPDPEKPQAAEGDTPIAADSGNENDAAKKETGKNQKGPEGISSVEAKRHDRESVEKEVDTLSERWRDWAYILPQYRLNNLTKRMDDLIEKTAESDAP